MRLKYIYFPVLFFFFAAYALFSQEAPPVGGAPPSVGAPSAGASNDDTTLYVIAAYEFDVVKGRSRPSALIYKLVDNDEFREGEVITGKANLEKYISVVTQIYINQRVLKDNVEVTYSEGQQQEDGTIPVTIMIKVEDSWNIIALPRPFYKNGALDLTIKARDYNFFGTMRPLRVDLGYNYDEDERHAFLLGVFYDITFKALGYYWDLSFDNTFQYRVDAPFYYQNATGLSMDLPFHSTTFTFGLEEKVTLNEENSDWAKDNGYGDYQDGMYMSSNLYVSWKIPTGFKVSKFGDLTYNPGISVTFNHELPQWPLDDFRKGPFFNFSHSLGFGKIDWHGNYREGLSVSLGNSYQYDFHQMFHSVSLGFTAIGHLILKDYFAVSSRIMYQYWYSSDKTSEGGYVSSYMRGIKDDSISAYQMFLINIDLPLRLFVFRPSKWLNSKKLAFFDFEFHASPVIDIALYQQKGFDGKKIMYEPAGYAVTGGLEFVVFPLFMRNLYIRFGVTADVKEFLKGVLKDKRINIPDGDHREIYLIMGHHY